jgi:hypothetical protein
VSYTIFKNRRRIQLNAKIILALGIISGLEPAYDKWEDFCGNIEKPRIGHRYEESLSEYRDRIELIIKKAAIEYLGKLLNDVVNK